MRRHRLAAVALVAVLAACSSSDDDEQATASTTTSSTTSTTTTAAALDDCPSRPQGESSPAVFDDAAGTYAAQSLSLDSPDDVRFDVVQWLTGEDADAAYEAETGDSSGVPNDYYILNESSALRSAPLAADAVLHRLASDGGGGLVPLDRADLAPHLAGTSQDTWWLTFEDGAITGLCQQYRP